MSNSDQLIKDLGQQFSTGELTPGQWLPASLTSEAAPGAQIMHVLIAAPEGTNLDALAEVLNSGKSDPVIVAHFQRVADMRRIAEALQFAAMFPGLTPGEAANIIAANNALIRAVLDAANDDDTEQWSRLRENLVHHKMKAEQGPGAMH